MFVSEEISLNGSGSLIRSFWVAFCFIRGVLNNFKNSGKSSYSESKLNFICSIKALFFFFFLIWIWVIALSGCYSAKDRA